MPKIQWTDLPPPLRDHLFDRARERKITAEELRGAIRIVGNSIATVRAYVASRRRGRTPLIRAQEVLES